MRRNGCGSEFGSRPTSVYKKKNTMTINPKAAENPAAGAAGSERPGWEFAPKTDKRTILRKSLKSFRKLGGETTRRIQIAKGRFDQFLAKHGERNNMLELSFSARAARAGGAT
jgi:hypothetical protein